MLSNTKEVIRQESVSSVHDYDPLDEEKVDFDPKGRLTKHAISSIGDRISVAKDEREDVQKKTFAKWINSQLSKRSIPPITDLFYDLRDGTKLLSLLEILTESKCKRERGRMRVHHLNNVGRALKVLEEQKVKLVNISNEDIVDGSPKITLGLVWAIILHWQVQGVLRDVMSELQQTNLEKTLLAWCRQTTQGYQGVDVRNFTTSWRDGLAFCALLHRHRPDFFEWPVMAKKHPYARLDNAFRVAQEHLGIERLLDPEDVNTQNPDKKSLMMYVMCLFQALPHSSISMDSLNISVQSDSSFSIETPDSSSAKDRPLSTVSTGLGSYQQTLEEVLTWLLGAEDRLAGMPAIADNTKDVKEQFHELEDLMLDLTARQGSIGDVLGEGSRLLRENQIGEEEGEEVRVQMKLLNTRWEELRIKAMDRQTSLHEQLMKLQQEELDILKQWLTSTEDRIANMSELGPTYEDLESQITAHQTLQNDLEAEQENINSLSNMVVVVDENNVDSTYTSLEDELNALGERWAHICKWAEQRWITLQNLQVQWREFERELKQFQQWLKEKENLLKEMESSPTEDKQELYKQATSLKVLESEMESQTRRQSELSDRSSTVLSHLPQDSAAREDFPVVLESMEDRLDCLISILEAQRQRLLSNGIDLSTLPSFSSREGATLTYTSTATTTTTIVAGEGSSPHRKTSMGEKMGGLTPKRQKMSGRTQEEFLSATATFISWLERLEQRLDPSVIYLLPIQEMKKLRHETEQELNTQKEEYRKVLSLGQSATSETATIGESTVDNEKKMTSMKSRWATIEKQISHLKLRIQFAEELKLLKPKLEEIKREFIRLEEWVNSTQSTTQFDRSTIVNQIEECQKKKKIIKEKETELSVIEKNAQNLPSLWPEEKDEVLRDIQALVFDFRNLAMRITNWEFILNDQAKSEDRPESVFKLSPGEEVMEVVTETHSSHLVEELSGGLEELSGWLAKVEEQLEACPAVAPLPKMQDDLVKLKIMLEEVDNERVKLGTINKSLQDSESSLSCKVEDLNKRWDRIVDSLVNRVSDIEKCIDTQRHFEEEISGLRSWLGEVEAFLEAEEAAIGDIETLQAQLEQSNALQDDIETLKSNVVNISNTARHFESAGDSELKESLTGQITSLNERWESAVAKATEQNANLKEALEKSRKALEEGDKMKEWIDGMESKIPQITSVETTSELNKTCSELAEIENQIDKRKEAFQQLNKLGHEIMNVEKTQPSLELSNLFEHLNDRWKWLLNEVASRKNQVSTFKDNYEQFKKLCSEESRWLDQLEEKLEKSNLKSTDAEEISEALYDLDNFVGSHSDCLEKAQEIGSILTKEGIMSVAIQNSLHNLTSRFDLLTSKANDQQQSLEGGVEEAQDLEREYVKVLENLSSSLKLMNQYPEGNHISEIENKLVSHQEVLQKMEQRVESYRTQGKGQAAQRLQDQLTHLVKQYEEVEEKLKVIKQSKDFDEKLMSISEKLSTIDEKSREFDVQSADSEHLEGQLNQCMELYRSLSLVKSNVESVIATGRKIVKEGMTSDPDTLTLQLDQLKALYNQLGGSVTEQRGRLESGLKQSKKVEKDSSQLEEWLNATEKELDLREATLPVQNFQQELEFAQHALDDVMRKKPVLANVKESLAILVNLFGSGITIKLQEQVQDQTLSWERVQKRLSNRIANLKKEQNKTEEEMEKFIMKVGEIQAWLEKTEAELDKCEELSTSEKESLLKLVSNEVQDYRMKLEETRETSEDFVAHGTLFESRLEPEMSRIKRRLEYITGLIKMKESKYISNINNEKFQRPLTDQCGRTEEEEEVESIPKILNSRHHSKSSVEGKDSSLHAKKRFGKVYKSDEMTLLDDNTTEKRESRSSIREQTNPRLSYDGMWSSSSSSARFSQSEGSVDFGSESQVTWSGDFEDFVVNEEKPKISSSPSAAGSDIVRFSFASFGSFETSKDEVFLESLTEDIDSSIFTNPIQDSSSSDDESDIGNASKYRISAATVYENEAMKELENSLSFGNKYYGRAKSVDLGSEVRSDSLSFPVRDRKSVPLTFSVYPETLLAKLNDPTNFEKESSSNIPKIIFPDDAEVKCNVNKDASESRHMDPEISSADTSNESEKVIKTKLGKDSAVLKNDQAILTVEYMDDKPVGGIPVKLRLERQLSIDSSVSTLSEAETVIHVSESSAQKSSKEPTVKKVSSFNDDTSKSKRKSSERLSKSVSSDELGHSKEDEKVSFESEEPETPEGRPSKGFISLELPNPSMYEVIKKKKAQVKQSSHESLVSKTSKHPKEKVVRQSSKSLSSISSGSVEEQEISLDISDPSHSDSSSISKKELKQRLTKSPVHIKPEAEDAKLIEYDEATESSQCFVIGNRYAELLDKKSSGATKAKKDKKQKMLKKLNETAVKSVPETTTSKTTHPEKFKNKEHLVKGSSDTRFSIGSFCTDVSEGELIFSETEGEELPYDDTTDDDLNFEDEALRELAERKETMKEETIDGFLNKVTRMVDKISLLRDRADKLPKYSEADSYTEDLEQEVCQLEPDVATLISKGDTLTLKTHMSDVPKANAIRVAVNNLRSSWMDLKERGEILKTESERLKKDLKESEKKGQDFIRWLDEISKRLELANNDEKQIKILEKEIAEKRNEYEQITASGELLKKYRYEELQPLLTLISIRWTEINALLAQYQKSSVVQKSIGEGIQQMEQNERAVVPDFLANVNRVRENIYVLSRRMNSKVFSGKTYENLKEKDDELKGIKKELERLKPKVDSVENDRLSTMKKANPSQTDQVRRVIDKLREEWAQVNRGYTDKYELWVHCIETRRSLNKTIDEFSSWMDSIEERVRATADHKGQEARITQKEMEKQVTLKHRPSQALQTLTKEVSDGLSSEEARSLQDQVDELLRRWRALLLDLSARRERIASERVSKGELDDNLESVISWVDQGQSLMDAHVNVTDESSLAAHNIAVKNHLYEMDTRLKLFNHVKNVDSGGASPLQVRTVETNLMKVVKCLPEYSNKVETKLKVAQSLNEDAETLYQWLEELRVKIALRSMTVEEIKRNREMLREKSALYESLDNTYWALSQDAESKGLSVSEPLKSRMNSIEARLKTLESQFSTTELMTSLGQTSESTVLTSTTPYDVSMVATAAATPISTNATASTSVTNSVKLEDIRTVDGDASLPPAPFPKTGDSSSPTLILAALDKSILQIRDWLTLMQQMSSQQTAVVGESDNIRKLIEKQKSVLRELESKKPQLDELVASADSLKEDEDRTQLHQQVSKLRDHWDETNSSVLARKTQLDAMLNDTHKFDSKRIELETWLSRMESRLERMNPIARTSEVLDQQIREQKAFHAEVHQYKHHMELFSQMISRLVTIYQNDDTRQLKKASESINQRYSNLNANIVSRGKALYSAMNSSHNLSKALEKFISWLSEAESTVNSIEMEVDKLPPSSGCGRRDSTVTRAPYVHLKDLQSEIESHKDVLASLNATGQKLLGTLENQDEAMLLHRRLGEMNHRWNTLKYKSIAIRNRLEGTAENWNSLLLSLRELIEWVIRKDTELTALGPVVGDLKLLAKYENDLTIFRRGLDEKQPVIESNLKSGRQLIASEPPLSDTSDSEAGRDLDGDARYRGEESTRDLTRSVRREVTKLSEKWAALWERAANLAAQVSLANKKLGVLLKTVEEVGSRLEESEKIVGAWGPFPQDQNLADQHVHNIRKFRETLPDLQRGIDDVNDQAARFSAHNVPLTPPNSAALHDLNNRWKNLETNVNDRWRQIAGRSREVTPLTPAQLASSVSPPWERATATNKVPYYINHAQETTHWDHPDMMDLLDSLSEFNHIKFSAYRTATKLRSLQKKLALDRAKLQMVTDVFDEHGLRGQNDRLIDVSDMIVVLSTLYGRISSDNNDVNTTLTTDLCLNWLLNVYDSQRTGQMRVLSFRVGLICLCRGHLEEKYRYMFRLIADPNRLVDQRKLGLLLHDCVQVPRQLGEVAAFGGSNIEPSVRSCFTKAGKDRETIEAVHFLTWVQQEPQSLVWLAVLHRVAASESVQHQVKCNICKTSPIVGLRYRCLKCLSFDMCQRCFFEGRSTKSHKITHPMHEYCTETRAGDEMKDFTKALKNKFKSKRSLQKHTKKGYLPVQTVLEGDPIESPSPSPSHNVSSQDMHSRLELYASRLAEVELRTNSNSTPDSEDEHGLIAQYCQSLSSTDAPFPVPKSPLQIMASVDADQKDELEQMIRDLEEENRALQAEYERLKSEQPTTTASEDALGQRSEAEMLAEAKLLREHKGRLEARMNILEDHNRQLEAQLQRLRQLLVEQQSGVGSPNKSGTLQTKSVTASQLAMDSPAKINGHSSQGGQERAAIGKREASMNREKVNDSLSGEDDDVEDHSDENDYDNTVSASIQVKNE